MEGTLTELVEPAFVDGSDHNEGNDAPIISARERLASITQPLPGYPHWQPPTMRFGDLTFTPNADIGLSRGAFQQSAVDPDGGHYTAACDCSDESADAPDTDTLQAKLQRLEALSAQVRAGDQSASEEIRNILTSDEQLWQSLGNAEAATERMLIEYMSGSAANKEAVRIRVTKLKQSLVSDDSTPLEQLAVGRVVACWLFCQFVERWSGFAIKESGRTSGLAKLLESSEKRLQTAIKSLKLAKECDDFRRTAFADRVRCPRPS